MLQNQTPAESGDHPVSPVSAETGGGAPACEDDAMEFKPAVKYVGLGLAVLLLAGVEYATYSVGYDRGYGEAISSGTVQEKVNAAAVENLTHFMQMAVSGDKELINTVKNHEKALEWIREPSVRMEAEWTLAQALIDRDLVAEGTEMLAALIPAAPPTELWARRATLVAGSFAKAGQEDAALAYYRLAAGIYAALEQPERQIAVLAEMVELLAASPAPVEEVIATLDALQQEVASLGATAKGLRSTILAYMGSLHRRCGDRESSLRCFEQALADMPADKMPALVGAAVSYGMALMEKGDTDKAEKLLRDSVSRLADSPVEIAFQVSAMRELARLEQERGNTEQALGLLYRAEGAAAGRIPADNPFWPCLFDQRGWINFVKQLYDSALTDFAKALQRTEQPDLLAQPLEGSGRCCLAMGKSEEAIQHLTRAVELRRQYMPAAKAELGRVCLLLGQAYDMDGRNPDAIEAYEQSCTLLPADSSDLHFARMSLAYAYSQAGRWSDAYPLWDSLQSVYAEDSARRAEVQAQLALCRRKGAGTRSGGNPEQEDVSDDTQEAVTDTSAAAATSFAPRSRTVRRARRSTARRR